MIENSPKQRQLAIALSITLFIIGIVYVYFALSPSHYSYFLKNHLGQAYQPIAGQAYGVRSDEWGVVTPYFQIAVNNEHQRYNQDSPYKEDLRFFYGLPLKDWALALKPYMWGFFTLGDARGFSFYHFFMIAAFIVGYTIFLRQLRLPLLYAVIIALTLFFSHHNQVWWSGNAPVYGLTVWIIIPFLTRWPLVIKLLATFLISAAALLGLIYPPTQISMVYVFGILALAFRMDRFRPLNLLVCLVGFVLGAGVCFYYLADVVPLLQNTVYPGDRSFSGGMDQLYYLWTLLFPHSLIGSDYRPLVINSNISEIGTVSSLLSLSLLVFGDYKRFFKMLQTNKVAISILGIFLVLVFGWMYLDIPNTVGKFLLFDQIEPKRFLMASGTLVSCLVATLALYNRWQLTWLRLTIYSGLVLVGSYTFKLLFGRANAIDRFDVFVLIPVAVVLMLKLFKVDSFKNQRKISYLFATVALLYNVFAFGGFNPVQSAHDIFATSNQPKIDALKDFVDEYDLGPLGIPMHTAAAASGLSLVTYNHVLPIPQLEVFKKLFPDLDDATFNTIFNRYMHVSFNPTSQEPILDQADAVTIPLNILSSSIPVIDSNNANSIEQADTILDVQAVSYNWYTDDLFVMRFKSPKPLSTKDVSVVMPIVSGRQTDVVEAALRPTLLLTKYFSEAELAASEAIVWELELDFSSVDNAKIVYDNLPALELIVAGENVRILLQNQEIIEAFAAKTGVNYPIKGVVDNAIYDAASATLMVTGWAPISGNPNIDEQLLRWFAYDTDLELEVSQFITITRPDVAAIFGETQKFSGFTIVFEVANPPAINDDIEFCFYSRTKGNDTYQVSINANTLPLLCSGAN